MMSIPTSPFYDVNTNQSLLGCQYQQVHVRMSIPTSPFQDVNTNKSMLGCQYQLVPFMMSIPTSPFQDDNTNKSILGCQYQQVPFREIGTNVSKKSIELIGYCLFIMHYNISIFKEERKVSLSLCFIQNPINGLPCSSNIIFQFNEHGLLITLFSKPDSPFKNAIVCSQVSFLYIKFWSIMISHFVVCV